MGLEAIAEKTLVPLSEFGPRIGAWVQLRPVRAKAGHDLPRDALDGIDSASFAIRLEPPKPKSVLLDEV